MACQSGTIDRGGDDVTVTKKRAKKIGTWHTRWVDHDTFACHGDTMTGKLGVQALSFMLRRGIQPAPRFRGEAKESKASYSLHSRYDIVFRGSKGGGPGRTPRLLETTPGLAWEFKGSGWHTLNRSRRGDEEDGQTKQAGMRAWRAGG